MARLDQFKPAPQASAWEDELTDLSALDRIRVTWERPAVRWLTAALAVVVCLVLWNMKSGLANGGQDAAGLVETANGIDPPSSPGPAGIAENSSSQSEAAAATTPAPTNVTVHVIGPVRRPGVVTLPAGSRVADALDAVGGMTSGKPKINLARLLTDGEQVNPARSDSTSAGGAQVSGANSVGGTAGSGEVKINLNTATIDQLQQLPRVGPATAQKIMEYRTANGPFKSIDQLQEIPGIGEKTFAALAPLISV